MGQEYFINSQELEDKIRQLLPSQGGAGAGFDLSASTQIIPIIDLTESAEGSNFRQDLQTALSFGSATAFNFANSTVTLANTTGYWRVVGTITNIGGGANTGIATLQITDGASTKIVYGITFLASSVNSLNNYPFDFIIFLKAGETLQGLSPKTSDIFTGSTRQIADIDGNLVNP